MGRGLEGRRIALQAGDRPDADETSIVTTALEGAGATVQRLRDVRSDDEWHSGRYAALVALGELPGAADRVEQLAREFLVAGKPIAAHGHGLSVLLKAGGLAGRRVSVGQEFEELAAAAGADCVDESMTVDENLLTAGRESPITEFAERVTREFSRLLEESEVDEMSELSFPASDPPAVSPSTLGGKPDREPPESREPRSAS